MTLQIIATGSAGNCYLLRSSKETLIIESGVKVQVLKEALDFNLSSVVGCIVTHEHKDHAGHIIDYMKSGIDCYVSDKTYPAIRSQSYRLKTLQPVTFQDNIGSFFIQSFEARHDVPCVGFLIFHIEMGLTLFLTDTIYSPYTFPVLDHAIIEANYCEDIVAQRKDSGSLNGFLHDRVIQSHMSIQTAVKLLKANNLARLKTVTLIHASDNNSTRDFAERVTKEIGVRCIMAEKNMSINLSKTLF